VNIPLSVKVANIVDVYSLFSDELTALAAEEAIAKTTINSIYEILKVDLLHVMA